MYHARNIVYAYRGVCSYMVSTKLVQAVRCHVLQNRSMYLNMYLDINESHVFPPNMLYTSKLIYIKLGTISRQ